MEFHENKPIKKYLIDGACLLYAYYFSKIYIVCHIIRQENTKITILLLRFNSIPKSYQI